MTVPGCAAEDSSNEECYSLCGGFRFSVFIFFIFPNELRRSRAIIKGEEASNEGMLEQWLLFYCVV